MLPDDGLIVRPGLLGLSGSALGRPGFGTGTGTASWARAVGKGERPEKAASVATQPPARNPTSQERRGVAGASGAGRDNGAAGVMEHSDQGQGARGYRRYSVARARG